ncbi:hypothetical protein [Salmonella sp. s54925]|uniref:hypothetical protein n=1 Tax=Salmonella sp. s54925 TaxID=3159674 RepID=UPI00397F58D8
MVQQDKRASQDLQEDKPVVDRKDLREKTVIMDRMGTMAQKEILALPVRKETQALLEKEELRGNAELADKGENKVHLEPVVHKDNQEPVDQTGILVLRVVVEFRV